MNLPEISIDKNGHITIDQVGTQVIKFSVKVDCVQLRCRVGIGLRIKATGLHKQYISTPETVVSFWLGAAATFSLQLTRVCADKITDTIKACSTQLFIIRKMRSCVCFLNDDVD